METEPERFILSEITDGDLVRIVGVNDEGMDCRWNAVVVGTLRATSVAPDTLQVSYAERQYDGIALFRDCIDEVDLAAVELHVQVDPNSLRSITEGWRHLGFIPLDENTLWVHGESICPSYGIPYLSVDYCKMIREIYGDETPPHFTDLFEEESESEEWDPLNNLEDLVELESLEPFTEAPEDSEFVRETHAAVRAMSERNVIGDTNRQRDVRNFLNALHHKYAE
jgi:hypothetical protein